jgi:hypothetical protein
MANNLIQFKRTSVSGRAANTTTLPNAGELALNMADGILYSTNGSVVFEIGANNTNVNVSNTLTIKAISANGSTGSSEQVLTSNGNGTYWSSVSSGGFANGQSISVNDFVITGSFTANNSSGTEGQVLTSNGSGTYWSNVSGGGSTFPYLDYGFIYDTPPVNISSPIDYGSL